jgi:hypothetical protein
MTGVRLIVTIVALAALILVSFQNGGPLLLGETPPSRKNENDDARRLALFSSTKNAEKIDDVSSSESKSEQEIIEELTQKLAPRQDLRWIDQENQVLEKHQFLHLHHMKTGGTSMDQLIRCSMKRIEADSGIVVPYGNIHECSKGRYDKCKSKEDKTCNQKLQDAAFMSYCAPLKDLPAFGWADGDSKSTTDALTVLRHPVDRVWSMFRFQTKRCFDCTPLIEVYEKMAAGDIDRMDFQCLQQLDNHEVANLLSTEGNENASDDDLVEEAISNMKSFFTMIGLTEELNTTVKMAGMVFPWLNETVPDSELTCPLPHANSSPKNNACGPGHTHWDLPPHPDEETRKVIEEHNQLDLRLYEAAKEHFEMQKRALGLS